jgi:hypothetical protein
MRDFAEPRGPDGYSRASAAPLMRMARRIKLSWSGRRPFSSITRDRGRNACSIRSRRNSGGEGEYPQAAVALGIPLAIAQLVNETSFRLLWISPKIDRRADSPSEREVLENQQRFTHAVDQFLRKIRSGLRFMTSRSLLVGYRKRDTIFSSGLRMRLLSRRMRRPICSKSCSTRQPDHAVRSTICSSNRHPLGMSTARRQSYKPADRLSPRVT